MSITTASLLPSPPRRRHDEDDLQRAVVQYLRWALPDEATCFAVPNGGLRHRKAAARLVGLGVKAGIPDLCVVYRSRAYFIELKTARGAISAAQKQMARRLEDCGCPVMLCRSVEEVEAALREEACVPLRASCA